MKAIWKYVLNPNAPDIYMPVGAEILSVGMQGGNVCLWVMVNPKSRDKEFRRIESYGTGHEITKPDGLKFISTTTHTGEGLVFHHFERIA